MTNSINSYSDDRLCGSLLVKPLSDGCKRLTELTIESEVTAAKVARCALLALANIALVIVSAPLALVGRIFQVIHYHSLSPEFRADPSSADLDISRLLSCDVTRIGNHSYLLFDPAQSKKIIVTTPEGVTPDTSSRLAQAAAQTVSQLLDTGSAQQFKIDGIDWKLGYGEQARMSAIVAGFLNSFVHKRGDDGVIRLNISRQDTLSSYRGKLPTYFDLKLIEDSALDPFTQMTIAAAQQLESNYSAPDGFTPHDDPYVFTVERGNLRLKARAALTDADQPGMQEALNAYRVWMDAEYGDEKIATCGRRYGCSLDEAQALTPEHVFRFNIGVNDIDMGDLNGLLIKLADKHSLTEREERGVKIAKLDDIAGIRDASQLNPEQFARLCGVFEPEDPRILDSGRQIYEESGSCYATAGLEERKPWIDRQEMRRIFPLLAKKENWELFYEKSVFTAVKMHLFRENIDGALQVGNLLPAPADSQGGSRWYRVSSFASNGYGIVSYTLESACNDLSLPMIKLYRSTASDGYQFESNASMFNNANPLNSPGYHGTGAADPYEKPFFEKMTIPLWVLYLDKAGKLLDQGEQHADEVNELLKSATGILREQAEAPLKNKSFKAILRSNDAILNDLYMDRHDYQRSIGVYWDEEYQYADLYRKVVTRYIHSDVPPDMNSEKIDSESLQKLLLTHPHYCKPNSQYRTRIQTLVDDLARHIIVAQPSSAEQQEFNAINKELLIPLANYQVQYEKDQDPKHLGEWIRSLYDHAKQLGELPKLKEQRNIVFAGHSLGGACAQAQFYHLLGETGRVAVPGSKVALKLYDSPKINTDDNVAYKAWAKNHRAIIEEYGVGIEICHYTEKGDFFPMGGEEHLGATTSKAERDELGQCIAFTGLRRERLPDAKEPTIAQAQTGHETQFSQGVKGVDYDETTFESYQQYLADKGDRSNKHFKKWEMPQPYGVDCLDGQTCEEIRRSVSGAAGAAMRVLRRWVAGGNREYADKRDDNGVLYVS
jgi:hypothetical protein